MEGPEFVVIIVAIICATGLIKTWINRNYSKDSGGVDEDAFDRLARAFMQHKKEMEERMRNVESVIAEDGEKDFPPQIEEPKNSGGLSNDLKQKDKVQS